jgi:riboflavin kinase/FMN adenylyltransferase
LFGFAGDLYGTRVAVRFRARLRGQRRFEGLGDLTAQLEADRRAAEDALAARSTVAEPPAGADDGEPG